MNPSRRSVAPVRKLVAAIVGTIAVFVMLFGLGMSSWPIVALGAAMLALAIGLALINVVRRGGRAWVAGTAHVVSASEPPASSAYGRCELQLVVAAPGLQASAVKVRDPRVPVAKWPDAGATLPVTVAVDDMRHVRIQWDEVMTHTEAMEEPEVYADPLRDLPVDDLLPEPEAPPWVTRDRQQWKRPESEAEPVTADLSAQLGDLREAPVVVREAPGGPIVLEGTLVDTDARPSTAPRRPRPSPRPSPRPRPQPAEPSPSPRATGPERTSDRDADAESDADADPDSDATRATAAATTAATTTAAAAAAGADAPDRDEARPNDRDAAPTDDAPAFAADPNGGGSQSSDDVVPGDRSGPQPDPAAAPVGTAAAQPDADADPDVDLALDEPDESTANAAPAARAADDRSDASRTSAGAHTGSPWYGDRPLTTGIDVAPDPSAGSAPAAEPSAGSVPPDSPNDSGVAQHPSDNDVSDHSGGDDTTIPTGGGDAGRPPGGSMTAEPTNEDAAPQSGDDGAPTASVWQASPESTGDMAPNAAREVAPGPDHHEAPESARDVAAEPDRDVASEPDREVASESDRDVASEPDRNVASEPDRNVASEPAPDEAPGRNQHEAAQSALDEVAGHPSDEAPDAARGGVAAVAAPAPHVSTSAQAANSDTGRSGTRQGRLAGVRAAGAKAAGAVAAMAKAAGAKAVGMKSTGTKSADGSDRIGSAAAGPTAAGSMAAGSVAAGSVAAGSLAAGSVAAGSVAAGSGAAGAAGGPEWNGSAGDRPAASAADRARAAETDDTGIGEVLTAYPSARPGPAGAIHGVGVTALVTDLDRSTRFYRDMLGFFEIDNGGGSAVLASGDTRLVLRTVHELSPTTGRLIYLNLEVGDVDAVYEELRAKGVTFVHEPRAVNRGDKLELWAASFHDPDGHNIAVTQWRAVT